MRLRAANPREAYWRLADAQARAQGRAHAPRATVPRGLARVGLAPGAWGDPSSPGTRVGLAPVPEAYDLTFRVSLFQGDHDVEQTKRAIEHMLEALVKINVDYLAAHPEAPGVYEAGVRYQAEEEGEELWQDVPAAVRQGTPDCEDLAAWRVAELVVRHGVAARPRVTAARQIDGRWLFHITVQLPDGSVEDPSVVLGMR